MVIESDALENALYFLHVSELKAICQKFNLSDRGVKIVLIDRIVHYVATGQVRSLPLIPKISCSEKGKIYELKPETLMLKGAYKNDLKTRQFFKRLVGEHFYFTAHGIDYIKQRWLAGNPPTYQEFGDYWQKEFEKSNKRKPKKEWTYINFIQNYLKQNPYATNEELHTAWNNEREVQLNIVQKILDQNLKDEKRI